MVYSNSQTKWSITLKKTLLGLAKLSRFNEYVYFVIITTLLGVSAAKGTADWRLFLVLIPANWLAVGFAFMINDIEDAPDDALSNEKRHRNPVSAGLISPKTARIATFIVGLFSAGLFALLGFTPFIFGIISLILGVLYSIRQVRLKTIAFFDILSHSLMLAGLQYLCAYFTYSPRLNDDWFWPLIFVMSISIYGELFNEMRDIEGDRSAQLRHTAITLGERPTQFLMIVMLAISILSGVISLLFIDLIPVWVFIIMAALVGIFLLPVIIKLRRSDSNIIIQGVFHKPIERAAALAFVLQYALPWLNQLWNLGLF